MDNPSLDWEPSGSLVEQPQLDPYSNAPVTAPLPDDVANRRATKIEAAFSTQDQPPSREEIVGAVQSGREDLLQQRMASAEAARQATVKSQMIRQVVDSGTGTPDQLDFLQTLSYKDITQPTNIIEKKYAEWRVSTGLAADESGTVDKALEKDPETLHKHVDASVDRIQRKEVLQGAYDRVKAKYDQTGFGRTIVDTMFDIVPLATAMEDRNVYPENVLAEGVTPGTYRQSANRDLYAMPFEEFSQTIEKMEKDADQTGDYYPVLKAIEAAQNYSAYAAQVDTGLAVLAASDLIPGVGITGDIAFGVGKSAVTRGARAIAKKEALARAREAVAGGAREGGSQEAVKAAGEAASPSAVDSTAQGMAEQANAAAGRGTTTVTANGQTATVNRNLRQETVDPDGRRWPPAMGGPIDRTAVTGLESVSDKSIKERYDYIQKHLYPDPNNPGKNNLTVEEQNKLVDQLKTVQAEYDKRAITPGNSLYVPEEAAGPTDRERILSIAQTGREPPSVPTPAPEEITLAAAAEKIAGNPKSFEELQKELQDNYRWTVDGQVEDNLRKGFWEDWQAALDRQTADNRAPGVVHEVDGEKYQISIVDNAASRKRKLDEKPLVGNVVYKDKADPNGINTIQFNEERAREVFNKKLWNTPTGKLLDGARHFPKDAFKTFEEFKDFVIQHEISHIYIARRDKVTGKNLTVAEMEDEVTRHALSQLGRKDLLKEMYPEIFARKKAPGPDPDVVPAAPKVSEVAQKPKGEWVNPSARGATRPPKEAPAYSVEMQKIQKEYQEARKKQSQLADQIAFPSRHFPELVLPGKKGGGAKIVKKLNELRAEKAAVDKELARLKRVIDKAPKLVSSDVPHISVDIPNPRTGGTTSVQIPATEENLARTYADNIEQSALGDDKDLANTFVAHGDIDRGAANLAFEEAMDGVETPESFARKLPSLYDPEGAVVGTPAHSSLYKLANNLKEKYKSVLTRQLAVNDALGKAINSFMSSGALRWSEDVYESVKPAMREQMDKYIGTPHTAILNLKIEYLREWETGLGRTNNIVYEMGRPDGTTFESVEKADLFAQDFYGLTKGAYEVKEVTPSSFIVKVSKPIDETDPNILKHAIQTTTQTPVTWVNSFLAYARGSAGTSSVTLQKNLATSAHHAKALHEAFMAAAKDISTLSKKEFTNLEALMEAKRDVEKTVYVNGQKKTVVGEWFNNAQELENTYKKAFGEYPSDNVTSAYFTMRQMYDFDLLYRNAKLYTGKARMGVQNVKFHIPLDDARNPGMVKWEQMLKSVEAIPVENIDNAASRDVLVLDADTAQAHLVNTGKAGMEGIRALQKDKGYKIYQLFNPNARPMKSAKVNDNYVQYVVARDAEVSPLTLDQLPASAGGHIRYKPGFFTKQPKFEITSNGQKLYLGDTTIFAGSSQKEAAKSAEAMETARKLLVAGDDAGLRDFLKKNTPFTYDKFVSLFAPKIDKDGKVIEEAALHRDVPITWVADGQGTNDAARAHAGDLRSHFEGVRDTVDDDTNGFRLLDKEYGGQKDTALQRMLQDDNAIWKFEKARKVSPLETLERAWADISRGMATDNLKIQAVTNWIEEAADVLLTPIEQMRKDPWEYFNNPQWNKQYADVARMRTLDAQRRQVLNFLGQKDQLGTTLDWMRNKLMNSVFDKFGGHAVDFVDDHLLPNVKNPLQFMRSFAFHAKMGFFNPIQLFLQAGTMLNTWAITGSIPRVGSALSGVMLMQAMRINKTPEVAAYIGKLSEKLGWKPGEFLEMNKIFHDQSLHIVEGEVGSLAIMTNPSVYKSKVGMALDKGLMFFRESERAVRMNAWAVAYKEFRDKFPTKVLNNEDVNTILRRSEILSGNMTKGSNAIWQSGLTGPMTQFWGYQARITEQILGKQLTRAERMRLVTAYAAMYGIPVSLGAATFMQIPGLSTDDLRQYAQDHGIDINSGWASAAVNGIPAEVIRMATADENGQNGLLLNIGDRTGPGGLAVLKNLVEARDGTADAIVDFVFGASGSITRDVFKQMLPNSWDAVYAAADPASYTVNDIAGMFSTISTVSNTTKLIWALNTHKEFTRSGIPLGDKSALSAWISFSTGLDEQWVKDTMLKMDSMKDLKTHNDELRKEYIAEIRRAMALSQGDTARAAKLRKANALTIGVDPKEVSKWVKDSIRGQEDLRTSVDIQYQNKVLNK